MRTTILFWGGNGHSSIRLEQAQQARIQLAPNCPFDLIEMEYPGFEHRPKARNLSAFLDICIDQVRAASLRSDHILHYGTGIGGLLLLALRARGDLNCDPILLQGPVLWGLKHRWMPRMMRIPFAAALPGVLFNLRLFQKRFTNQCFLSEHSPATFRAFFSGYSACSALPDFFHWLTPALLRELEEAFHRNRTGLEKIEFWWGAKDHVVTPQELRWTEKALGRSFPLQIFPDWGHYPMMDDPKGWILALTERVAERGGVA